MPSKQTVELNNKLRLEMQITGKGHNWRITGSNGVVRYTTTSKKSCQEWLDMHFPVA